MTTATRAQPKSTTVRPATDQDLVQLIPVVRIAHERMGRHAAEYTPERTLELLSIVTAFPTTVLLLAFDGRKIVGYCWAEHVLDVLDFHVHEVYLRRGYELRPLWEAVQAEAARRECRRITALTFRKGGVRAFGRLGFRPAATYLIKEVR